RVRVESQGVAAGEVDVGAWGGGDQDDRQDAVRQGVGLLSQDEVALIEPGGATVDTPSCVAVADDQGGEGGQQQYQEHGQDELAVHAGVFAAGQHRQRCRVTRPGV